MLRSKRTILPDYYDLQQVLTERLDKAIDSSCDEIADMSVSFPKDKRTWAQIIKRHLKLASTEMLLLVFDRSYGSEIPPPTPPETTIQPPDFP